MNHPTNKDIEAVLDQISSINLAPVRNVRPWFPTSPDEITFRLATSEEVIYVSFPTYAKLPQAQQSKEAGK